MNYKNYQVNNIDINFLKTKKFNSVYLSIRFIEELEEENIEYRSLLSLVLRSKTNKYKKKIEIARKLEELYGATFYTGVSKRGNLSIMDFSILFINPELIQDENHLFTNVFKFLKEIIYGHKSFDKETLEEEKKLLIEDIKSIQENKFSLATSIFFSEMFKTEKYRFDINGKIDKIKEVTIEDLYDYYIKKFLNNKIVISVSGDIKKYEMSHYISNYFKSNNERKYEIIDNSYQKEITETRYFDKTNQMKQSIITMGYRTKLYIKDPLFYPFLVGNCILGGYMHSKLFKNVREKASLCYTINNYQDSYKGILFIQAGINNKDIKKAEELINKQVEDIKNGKFSLYDLKTTVKLMENDLKEKEDSLVSITNRMFYCNLVNERADIKETIKKINLVKKEDIINAFSNVKLDTVFVLKAGDDNEL